MTKFTDRRKLTKRRAVSGVLSAVILFAMLFTVGVNFFLFINSYNGIYDVSLATRASLMQDRLQENLMVAANQGSSNTLTFTLTNVGGLAANVVALFVTDPSGTVHSYGTSFSSNTNPALPLPVSLGRTTGSIDTALAIQPGNYVVKVLTQRGSAFTTTYPPSSQNLAAYALSSGALGDIYMQFSTFKYYSVAACGLNQCLTPQANGFVVPHTATSSNIAYGVRVTDLSSLQENITLDAYTLMMQVQPPTPGTGGGTSRDYAWYLISNTSSGQIINTYSPITLNYNQPVTLIFASSGPGTFSDYAPGISANTVVLDFIATHGCEGIKASRCTNADANYGQTIPYVSTLYT